MRKQCLPLPLWMGQNRKLFDQNIYVYWWVKPIKDGNWPECQKIGSIAEAKAFVLQKQREGVFAFASAPIPCNGNQHGVFVFNKAGIGANLLNLSPYRQVKAAYDSIMLFETAAENGEFQVTPPKVAKQTEDKVYMFVDCVFDKKLLGMSREEIQQLEAADGRTRIYTFRSCSHYFAGEIKTGHLKSGEYKDVYVLSNTYVRPISQMPHPLEWYADCLDFRLLDQPQEPDEDDDESLPE